MAPLANVNLKPSHRGRLWLGLTIVFLVGMAVFAALSLYVISGLGGGGGGIKVESQPSGASVLVNGQVAGATPLTIKGLPRGSYVVRLEKAEFTPASLRVDVGASGDGSVNQKLSPLARGKLIVDIKPADAEVLLDGELAGHTPLTLDAVEAGPHELLVRKTNFSSYSARIDIVPGEVSKYEGQELTDRILEMMESKVKTEPQRVGHYIDLAHYYFINDRMKDAAKTFAMGQETMNTPLDFDSNGFPGKDKMSPEEIDTEQRLRREDQSRFPKELDKHKNFQRKDTRQFRLELAEAFDNAGRRDVTSWVRTKSAATEKITVGNYQEAVLIYKEHIHAAPASSPDLPKAYLELIRVLCMQANVDGVTEHFNKFYAMYEHKDGVALRSCGSIVNEYFERPGPKRRADSERLLKIAEKSLRAGLELPCDNESKSQGLFDLAMAVYYQERPTEAVPLLRQSVVLTQALGKREDRELRLAEALRKTGDRTGAQALYERLKGSDRPNVRESANYGLIAIKQSDVKQ